MANSSYSVKINRSQILKLSKKIKIIISRIIKKTREIKIITIVCALSARVKTLENRCHFKEMKHLKKMKELLKN